MKLSGQASSNHARIGLPGVIPIFGARGRLQACDGHRQTGRGDIFEGVPRLRLAGIVGILGREYGVSVALERKWQ